MRKTQHRRVKLGLAPALTALLTAGALAQDVSPELGAGSETDTTQVTDEVIVRGRRLSDIEADLHIYIKEFLDEATQPPPGRGYARWNRGVCVGVHNLKREAAQYIIDRVSALALEVGLEPGEPGCTPQVNIVFSTDARQMAARMVESEPRAFRPVGGNSGMNLGLHALDNFVESEKAVRWWHVSLPVDSRTGAPAIEVPQTSCATATTCPPTIAVAGPSRVHSGIQDDLQYVIVIVDSTRLTGTTWEQLGDYLALVSVAQIDPEANTGAFDSILNLFRNPAAYTGLTDWDRNFVHALYTFNQERAARVQKQEIIGRIARRELSDTE